MFKENRLIHFSSTQSGGQTEPDANAAPKAAAPELSPKELNEAAEKKAKADQIIRIKDLKTKVQNANISKASRDLALQALSHEDNDEIELVEKLLEGKLTQLEFEEKYTEVQDKKRGIKSKKKLPDITNDVAARSAKAAHLKAQTPDEVQKHASFGKLVGALGPLSQAEQENQSKVEKLLMPYLKTNKLDQKNMARIVNLDPDSNEFTFYLKKYLGDLASDKKLIDKISLLKAEQSEMIQSFNETVSKIVELIESNQEKYNKEKDKYLHIKRLCKLSGLQITEGVKLEYLSLDNSLKSSRVMTQIQKIEFKRVESRYLDENEANSDEKKELEEEQLNMAYGLFITITNTSDGRIVKESLSQVDFLDWVNQMQVVEAIESKEDLEKRIDFSDYGQTLKAGMQLDYISGLNLDGSSIYKDVKILKIDKIKGTIELDEPVPIFNSKLTREDPVLGRDRTKKILTFGEFSKWFNSHSVEEKMTISQAQAILKKSPGVYKLRYPDLDAKLWEFNNLPIELKSNEKICWGENKSTEIQSIDESNIKLANGKNYTPGQFVRFVKDNEVERDSTIPSTEDIQTKLNEVLGDPASNRESKTQALPSNTADAFEKRGFLSNLWKDTNFLSINDLLKMFHTIEEFFKRNTERNSKRRAANSGKILPGRLGLEFKNLAQASENEEVDKIQGELKNQGVDDWRSFLLDANGNTDIIKACTNLLCEAGAYDFDDPAMWSAMNAAYREQVDEETYKLNAINLQARKNPVGKLPLDALKFIMDSMWGKPSGNNWFNQNKSAYNSEIGKFKDEANIVELADGSYEFVLHDMLVRHAAGEYVSPAKFEAYVRYIIETGKSTPEDKMYYLLAGYVTASPDGTYLLSKGKYGDINMALLNNMPHLDFFTRYTGIKNGTPEESRAIMFEIFKEFNSNLEPGEWNVDNRFDPKSVSAFLTEDIMTHKNVLVRISKILRNAREKLDHDDAHVVIPAMDSSSIMQIIGNLRGSDSYLSSDGYTVGLTGFNNYLKGLGNVSMNSESELARREGLGFKRPNEIMQQVFKSFLFYEASLTGRVKFGDYTVLSSEKLNSQVTSTGLTVRENANQVKEVLRKVLQAYGCPEKRIHLFLDYKTGKTNETKNKDHAQQMQKFPDYFDSLINAQGSDKMASIVQQAVKGNQLAGFGGAIVKREKKEEGEQEASSAKDDKYTGNPDDIMDDIVDDVNDKVRRAA